MGDLTLLDFMFMETCQALLGVFNNLDTKTCCAITCIKEFFSGGQQNEIKGTLKYLRIMRNYVKLLSCQPFYDQNRDFLESFTMLCCSFSRERKEGMRKLWVMNPNFVA